MRFYILFLSILLLLSSSTFARGKNYAVLISSIKGWENLAYSVQADVCHAYHLLIASGMSHDDIILMSFGDAAWDSNNAFPGQLYNAGTNNRTKPVDVNAGCGEFIDYIGYEVSPANFLAVITGNRTAVPKGRPVLESTFEDNVFISFEDHGSPGAVYFPDFAPLYAVDIINALHTMHNRWMYQRLVFYLMACESGSVFAQGMLPPNISIYATAAAAPDVSAYPVYCSPLDTVGGQPSGLKKASNCLASEFGLAWTNETETFGLTQSLDQQYKNVNASMKTSTPGQYGDLTWKGMPIGDIFTDYPSQGKNTVWADNQIHVSMPEDVGGVSMAPGSFKLFMLENSIKNAETAEEEAAAKADLAAELKWRKEVDQFFSDFADRSLALSERYQEADRVQLVSSLLTNKPTLPIRHNECMRQVDEAIAQHCGGYTDYSRKYAASVINTCRTVAEIGGEVMEKQLPNLMAGMCQEKKMTKSRVYSEA